MSVPVLEKKVSVNMLWVELFWKLLLFACQVFAASAAGFQSTGFEINSILVAYARSKACWTGVPSRQAVFVKKDFWKVRL